MPSTQEKKLFERVGLDLSGAGGEPLGETPVCLVRMLRSEVEVLSWSPDRGNPTPKRQGRGPELTGRSQCGWLRCGTPVRAGLKEAIGASWLRTKVKRRKAFLGWVSRPAAAMPDSCRWVRGRSGDVITAKSQRFTQGDLLGPEVSVGPRTKGRRPMAQQKSEDRVLLLPEGGCNAR